MPETIPASTRSRIPAELNTHSVVREALRGAMVELLNGSGFADEGGVLIFFAYARSLFGRHTITSASDTL